MISTYYITAKTRKQEGYQNICDIINNWSDEYIGKSE